MDHTEQVVDLMLGNAAVSEGGHLQANEVLFTRGGEEPNPGRRTRAPVQYVSGRLGCVRGVLGAGKSYQYAFNLDPHAVRS